eukprot:SAG22_NODE_663_length_8042_cov_12.157371_2_plen_213_part_00
MLSLLPPSPSAANADEGKPVFLAHLPAPDGGGSSVSALGSFQGCPVELSCFFTGSLLTRRTSVFRPLRIASVFRPLRIDVDARNRGRCGVGSDDVRVVFLAFPPARRVRHQQHVLGDLVPSTTRLAFFGVVGALAVMVQRQLVKGLIQVRPAAMQPCSQHNANGNRQQNRRPAFRAVTRNPQYSCTVPVQRSNRQQGREPASLPELERFELD